jgi:hypothetical protein
VSRPERINISPETSTGFEDRFAPQTRRSTEHADGWSSRLGKIDAGCEGPSILPPLARTLADLDGKATVGCIHLAEAISYRIAGERMTAAA